MAKPAAWCNSRTAWLQHGPSMAAIVTVVGVRDVTELDRLVDELQPL